jgi:hypothetical protein
MGVKRIVVLLTGMLTATTAYTVPVEWRATGTVDATPPPFLFPFTLNEGDAIDFDYRFDTAAACSACAPDEARYDGLLSSLSVRVNDATHEIPLTMSSLYLANDHAVADGLLDAFVLTFSGNDAGLGFNGTLALQNVFPSGPVAPFGSVELASLTGPPDPQAFPLSQLPGVDSNFFTFSVAMDGGFNSVGGNLDYSGALPTASEAVPEPATLALMLSGLLGIAFTRRSRRRC